MHSAISKFTTKCKFKATNYLLSPMTRINYVNLYRVFFLKVNIRNIFHSCINSDSKFNSNRGMWLMASEYAKMLRKNV